jgi:ABC-type glycerol-3-phosphate transport system permease component
VAALVVRAMPHVVLLTAHHPAFLELAIWSRDETPIVVLVAIAQPFTSRMLRAFVPSMPQELDDAAIVGARSRRGAFPQVIVPVMWPGIVAAGLFSLRLACEDFVVSPRSWTGRRPP